MKEIQGKSILARVIGSRLSLEDFALILVSFCFFHHKGSTVISVLKCHCLRKPGRGHGSRSIDSFHLLAVFNLH